MKDYEWLNTIYEYYKSLLDDKNAESRSLMPRTFRHDEKRTFVRCKICGQEHPTFHFLHNIRIQNEKINIWDKGYRICLPCAIDQSDTSFTCKSCGREFYYTNRTKIIHEIGRLNFDWDGQKWCYNCKKHSAKCSNCGNEVPIYHLKEFKDKRRNRTINVCASCFTLLLNNEKKWRDAICRTIYCRQCGRLFNITNGEEEFFSQKGMNLPNRCPVCRGKR